MSHGVGWTALSTEILQNIIGRCDQHTISTCSQVCKRWYAVATDPIFLQHHLYPGDFRARFTPITGSTFGAIARMIDRYLLFENRTKALSAYNYHPSTLEKTNPAFNIRYCSPIQMDLVGDKLVCTYRGSLSPLCGPLSGLSKWIGQHSGMEWMSEPDNVTRDVWSCPMGLAVPRISDLSSQSGEQHLFATSDGRDRIRIWDTQQSACVVTYQSKPNAVGRESLNLAYLNRKTLVSYCSTGSVGLWDTETGQCTDRRPAGSTYPIYSVDGGDRRPVVARDRYTYLTSGSGEDPVRLWDIRCSEAIASLKPDGHEESRYFATAFPSAHHLVAVGCPASIPQPLNWGWGRQISSCFGARTIGSTFDVRKMEPVTQLDFGPTEPKKSVFRIYTLGQRLLLQGESLHMGWWRLATDELTRQKQIVANANLRRIDEFPDSFYPGQGPILLVNGEIITWHPDHLLIRASPRNAVMDKLVRIDQAIHDTSTDFIVGCLRKLSQFWEDRPERDS